MNKITPRHLFLYFFIEIDSFNPLNAIELLKLDFEKLVVKKSPVNQKDVDLKSNLKVGFFNRTV